LAVLDGWRAISILLVLGCHLLPLGPKVLELNAMAGPMGMALFFTLSGFLITRFLLSSPHVGDFLIRRLFRILPIAWLGLIAAFLIEPATPEQWIRNLTFTANLPPDALAPITSHYWSLGVEVQFYAAAAIVFAVFGTRGLYALPVLAVAVTAHRVLAETPIDIVTWRRVDEILAGATLALMLHSGSAIWRRILTQLNPWVLLTLLALSSHPQFELLNYARPYVAALLVGCTLQKHHFAGRPVLISQPFAYIASVSYALYVIHQILQFTWLGAGDTRLGNV
jgi:peptidoglycan/LPS O-acetylase OafA/YrhL